MPKIPTLELKRGEKTRKFLRLEAHQVHQRKHPGHLIRRTRRLKDSTKANLKQRINLRSKAKINVQIVVEIVIQIMDRNLAGRISVRQRMRDAGIVIELDISLVCKHVGQEKSSQ